MKRNIVFPVKHVTESFYISLQWKSIFVKLIWVKKIINAQYAMRLSKEVASCFYIRKQFMKVSNIFVSSVIKNSRVLETWKDTNWLCIRKKNPKMIRILIIMKNNHVDHQRFKKEIPCQKFQFLVVS